MASQFADGGMLQTGMNQQINYFPLHLLLVCFVRSARDARFMQSRAHLAAPPPPCVPQTACTFRRSHATSFDSLHVVVVYLAANTRARMEPPGECAMLAAARSTPNTARWDVPPRVPTVLWGGWRGLTENFAGLASTTFSPLARKTQPRTAPSCKQGSGSPWSLGELCLSGCLNEYTSRAYVGKARVFKHRLLYHHYVGSMLSASINIADTSDILLL